MVPGDFDGQAVRNGRPRNWRRRVVRAKKTKKIKSLERQSNRTMTIMPASDATTRDMPGRSRCFAKRLPVNSNALFPD